MLLTKNKKAQITGPVLFLGAVLLLLIIVYSLNQWAVQYFDPGLFWIGVAFELIAIFTGVQANLKYATMSGSAGAVFILIAWTSAKVATKSITP